ncbi:MAG: conjugal transfer protein TraL [Syntrophobacteraceae bacterium]
MKVHMTLQGKGGVGKSFICALLAQYKIAKGPTPLCVDTDAVNGTFHGFGALNVVKLDILEGKEINRGKFDKLFELIVENDGNDAIVDSGASTFVPLWHYMTGNNVPELLAGMGRELVIHTVVTGGQALEETVAGFSQLAGQFPEQVPFVVWLNPYFGPVERERTGFEQFGEYIDLKDQVSAIVRMPQFAELFRRDLSDMLQRRLTFDEALLMPSFTIITRQRLIMIKRNLFQLLDGAVVL